jgi:hypothetical protein
MIKIENITFKLLTKFLLMNIYKFLTGPEFIYIFLDTAHFSMLEISALRDTGSQLRWAAKFTQIRTIPLDRRLSPFGVML